MLIDTALHSERETAKFPMYTFLSHLTNCSLYYTALLAYVKIAAELVLLQSVVFFFSVSCKKSCLLLFPADSNYSHLFQVQSPFSKVINNTDGSYVCRRTNNITCTRFKLQMHFYILCTTWTALSNLMRKKKNS